MKCYAGIGSREITNKEKKLIPKLAELMAEKNWVLYSGNSNGSDIAFQTGSNGKCVIMLPWNKFNIDNYDYKNSIDYFILGNEKESIESIEKYHPNPSALKYGGRALMARNYYQVMGYDKYLKVGLVICCANPLKNGEVEGGTGQAVRIALKNNIPVINIRTNNWKEELSKYI